MEWCNPTRYGMGHRRTGIGEYLATPPLIHLHGSVRWFYPVMNPQPLFGARMWNDSSLFSVTDPQVIDRFADLTLGDVEYSEMFGSDQLVAIRGAVTRLGVPAISIPVRSKMSYTCPAGHVTQAIQMLSSASKVLIVGWRGGEGHFLRDWEASQPATPPEIMIACGSADAGEETRSNLLAGSIRGVISVLDAGFAGLLISPELRWFLEEGAA